MENFKIFVGNLHYLTTNEDLKELFSPYSPISVQVIYDKYSGRSKGFAFICLDNRDHLNKAVNQLDGVEFKGHKLAIKEALPQPDRDKNIGIEITNMSNSQSSFSTFLQLQMLWNQFFVNEDSQSVTEDEITKKFNEQRDSINNEISQQKNEAQSQFAQIKNEYEKVINLLKPYL